MTMTATRTHHFTEQPVEVEGATMTAMVCEDCGTRMSEAPEGEDCLGARLDDATAEVQASPSARKGKRSSKKVLEEAAAAIETREATAAATEEPASGEMLEEPLFAAPAPRLPFPAPPFDAAAAFDRICSKRHAVKALRVTWEKKAAQAKESKAELEAGQEELEELIDKYEQEKLEAIASVTPRLVPKPAEKTDGTLLCAFEKQAGEPCPICRNSGELVIGPESEEHRQAAEQRFNAGRSVNVELMTAAEKAGWNLTLDTIEGFSAEQRERLQAWIDHGGDVPAILGRPHIADEAGSSVQPCKVCGNVLVDITVNEPFLLADKVGVDCEGPADETVAEA